MVAHVEVKYLKIIRFCISLTVWRFVVNESSTFVKAVALGSVQFVGLMGNARLPELSPSLAPPVPPIRIRNGQPEHACATISAGISTCFVQFK